MKVLIIEDEKAPAQNLISLLESSNQSIELIGVLKSTKEAIDWFKKNAHPDLVFSDVHLSDGHSFSIFDQVKVDSPIIFTTAHDQYALQAFKYNSIDYLLKPIGEEELKQSLDKFLNQRISSFDPRALLESFEKQEPEYQKRFMVTTGEQIKSVSTNQIAYFFGKDKYVYLITTDNSQYIIDHTLYQLEKLLDPDQFFRINRQFLISFNSISKMYSFSRGRVKVELNPPSKEDSVVSIDKASAFKKWLNR